MRIERKRNDLKMKSWSPLIFSGLGNEELTKVTGKDYPVRKKRFQESRVSTKPIKTAIQWVRERLTMSIAADNNSQNKVMESLDIPM